jgi:hypothetical protein
VLPFLCCYSCVAILVADKAPVARDAGEPGGAYVPGIMGSNGPPRSATLLTCVTAGRNDAYGRQRFQCQLGGVLCGLGLFSVMFYLFKMFLLLLGIVFFSRALSKRKVGYVLATLQPKQ